MVLVGFGGCDSKTDQSAYTDTIGPMSSVEEPGEDFVMDLDVVEKAEEPIDPVPIESPSESYLSYPAPYVQSDSAPVEPVVAILDEDQDGVDDMIDNCLYMHNPAQVDTDHDGLGNGCDGSPYGDGIHDTDQDGITDQSDNCPEKYNPDQEAC